MQAGVRAWEYAPPRTAFRGQMDTKPMMRIALAAAAAAALVSGAASAQTMAPASSHVIAAHKTAPNTAQATTTPTSTAMGVAKTSKTVVKGGPMTRTAASMDCSKQADAQKLHGKARQKMRTACMAAARKG